MKKRKPTPKTWPRSRSEHLAPRTIAAAEKECTELRHAIVATAADAAAVREVLATFGSLVRIVAEAEPDTAAHVEACAALVDLADEWAPSP